MNPDTRLKSEYGSIKKALQYCVDLQMNKTQSAEFLGIDRKTLRNRAERFSVTFPCGYATQDRTLSNEINSQRMTLGNQSGTMGGRRRWGK